MRWPLVSRRAHDAALIRQGRAYEADKKKAASEGSAARQRLAAELSDLKDEVALHIVAAEHPSSALSDARSMALSLREALAARGIDLRIELDRAGGQL